MNHTLLHNIAHITKFKSLFVEYVKVKGHSGLDGNDMADNMANFGRISDRHFDTNYSIVPNTLYIPLWNNTTIETPIRRFIRDLNQTAHQANWLINRPIRDYQLYRDSTHNSLIGFTNIATCRNLCCLNWTQHNT